MNKISSAVWITGASSGIGKALAAEFAARKDIVAGSSRSPELLSQIEEELNSAGKYFYGFPADISDLKTVNDTYEKISSRFEINCLINNAGITSFKIAENDSPDEIKKIIEVNLLGSIYAVKSVLPQMMEKKQGTIINILSVVTKKIFNGSSAYSASKAGLKAYSDVLREEVRKYNIRIINIVPGATRTSIWPDSSLEKYSERMMSPDDLAKLVYSLYSQKSNLVPEEIVIRPMKGDL